MAEIGKALYWAPRILGILLILFIGMFSLDVFEPGLTVSEIIIAFIMHNIPTMFLVAVLLVAWRYELIGGIAYILLALAYSVQVVIQGAPFSWILIIAGPAFLVGGLFIENWRRRRLTK